MYESMAKKLANRFESIGMVSPEKFTEIAGSAYGYKGHKLDKVGLQMFFDDDSKIFFTRKENGIAMEITHGR